MGLSETSDRNESPGAWLAAARRMVPHASDEDCEAVAKMLRRHREEAQREGSDHPPMGPVERVEAIDAEFHGLLGLEPGAWLRRDPKGELAVWREAEEERQFDEFVGILRGPDGALNPAGYIALKRLQDAIPFGLTEREHDPVYVGDDWDPRRYDVAIKAVEAGGSYEEVHLSGLRRYTEEDLPALYALWREGTKQQDQGWIRPQALHLALSNFEIHGELLTWSEREQRGLPPLKVPPPAFDWTVFYRRLRLAIEEGRGDPSLLRSWDALGERVGEREAEELGGAVTGLDPVGPDAIKKCLQKGIQYVRGEDRLPEGYDSMRRFFTLLEGEWRMRGEEWEALRRARNQNDSRNS